MSKRVIGWREPVSLPDWGITGLRAKIDTGARTSAIHVENLFEVGPGLVSFDVVLDRRHRHRHVAVTTKVTRESHVKSSNGEVLKRFFVRTHILVAGLEKEVEISLVNRDNMKVRMLVGRTALGDDFLVDAHQVNLSRSVD